MMIPLMSNEAKDWHNLVTETSRVQQIQKLIMGMQPMNSTFKQEDVQPMIKAQRIEKEMFEQANSRSEYYYMLAEKIYKFQRDLEQEVEQTNSSISASIPAHDLTLMECMAQECVGEITSELRNKYTTQFKEDLKPSPQLDVPLNIARRAENLCYERANSLTEYFKYTTDVYKVKHAMQIAEGLATTQEPSSSQSSSASTSQDKCIEGQFSDAVERIWRGERPDEQFNSEMLQLLMGIEKHTLNE